MKKQKDFEPLCSLIKITCDSAWADVLSAVQCLIRALLDFSEITIIQKQRECNFHGNLERDVTLFAVSVRLWMENFPVYTDLSYYFLCSANLGQIFSVILKMLIVSFTFCPEQLCTKASESTVKHLIFIFPWTQNTH